MKLNEPKPGGLMANPAFANVVRIRDIEYNSKIIQEEKLENYDDGIASLNEKLILEVQNPEPFPYSGEKLTIQPSKCLDGHSRGWRDTINIHIMKNLLNLHFFSTVSSISLFLFTSIAHLISGSPDVQLARRPCLECEMIKQVK